MMSRKFLISESLVVEKIEAVKFKAISTSQHIRFQVVSVQYSTNSIILFTIGTRTFGVTTNGNIDVFD